MQLHPQWINSFRGRFHNDVFKRIVCVFKSKKEILATSYFSHTVAIRLLARVCSRLGCGTIYLYAVLTPRYMRDQNLQ